MSIDMKNPNLSFFSSPDQVRNMHNYPRPFLNPMHNIKIAFLKFKGI